MNSNLRKKFFTGAMVLLVTVFVIPSFAGAFMQGQCRPEKGCRVYKKGSDYHNYRGYRERPYDKHRYYGHYSYIGHRYDYHGHWRSWEQWDRYARRHPQIYKHGTYYREGAHLMFRFCEPGTGNFFFFSIGG